IILVLFILALIPGLPESPRWLVLKGRDDKAIEVLCALSNLPEDDPTIQNQYKEMKDTVFEMARGSFGDCFRTNNNRNLHRTILGYVNQMFQQISGINIINYYAATIFQNNIGLSGFLSRLLAALNGTEYFITSWVAIFTIERFGRRNLMLFGAAAYRSLEEMDEIFQDVHGLRGAFDVVRVANTKPKRYGKHGELLIQYDETARAQSIAQERRRSSVAGAKSTEETTEKNETV
ncbi:MAG: hypothetical protein Q9165_008840, partial [Trypethelium subeluteriae]